MSRYLSGEYEHKLDAKGRVIMPSRFRTELGNEFWMTKGLDGCIYVYPDDEWKKFVDKLNVMPMASRNVRQFKRYLLSCAYPCDMDGQGRTLIPQPLREHAGIEKEAMVVGVGEKLEIWNKETYKKIVDEENLDMDDIADAINEMNLNI